ncbi:hypothetical protein AQUCO_01700701v1 [Aquilegia coerulea]|uniref:Fe2OG dioxygenase domain-containing protein n=1 Tax=Aquilegia coerulea TaxID=218851 RepID=A0A2G5DPB4_AQUCA|nr:hypothetical protein AQUCO_01700701v1 [Aquilegia coerulea]
MDTEKSNLSKFLYCDRAKEMKEFHETKAGVKGLVDSGIVKIPKIFIHPPENLPKESDSNANGFKIPVIDLEGVGGDRRKLIVEEIWKASETWGFFQIVNHGVPDSVLDEMIEDSRKFHEQPTKEKQLIYDCNGSKKVRFSSNGELYGSQTAHWSDTLSCNFQEDLLDPEGLPLICRDIILEYVSCIIKLKNTLSELFSEALGLSPDYLNRIECMKTEIWSGHYYPPCPEPDITLGNIKHTDPDFLTILLQDQTGGLQVLHKEQWVDVPPIKGALEANIGDLFQLITNDKFKSVEHRVLANQIGPRLSVATFFFPKENESKLYGPIKDMLSEDDPPIYRETSVIEYITVLRSKGLGGKLTLPLFKL